MILVDKREGSRQLIDPLSHAGLEVSETILPYGDLTFTGLGEGGVPVQIGIEFKTINEIVGSTREGRFTGVQLPGLTGEEKVYDYAWLLVEGRWAHNRHGRVIVPKRRRGRAETWEALHGISAAELESRINTYHFNGGCDVRFSNDRRDTVRFIAAQYRWWTDKSLDHHVSHLQIHRPQSFRRLSKFREAVMSWPGVGYKVSKAAEEAFHGSLVEAATANMDQWATLTTIDDKGNQRRFGMKAAEAVVRFCRGG